MQRWKQFTLGLLTCAALAGAGRAQTASGLLGVGDTVIGMGSIQSITRAKINDLGQWFAYVDTNYSIFNRDQALLRSGFVTLREGDPVFEPEGATFSDLVSIDPSRRGNLGMVLKINVPGMSTPVQSLYWNGYKITARDEVITAPELGPGSNWSSLILAKMSGERTVYALGEINNTNISATSKSDSLVRFDLDANGNVVTTTVLATAGQAPPVLGGDTIKDLFGGSTGSQHGLAVNAHDDFIVMLRPTIGGTAYIRNMNEILAQEAAPSPLPGRTWKQLLTPVRFGLNDAGDYCFSGTINGVLPSDPVLYVVIKSGQIYVRQGQVIPTLSPNALDNGGPSPMYISNSGDMFWFAKTTGSDDAFMRNLVPIVQQNVTSIGPNLVTKVESNEDCFDVSDNGRYWVGRVVVQAIGSLLVYADFGLISSIPGCFGNQGTFTHTDGMALPGETLRFELDNAQTIGALPLVMICRSERFPGNPCGANTPYGELLVNPATRIATVPAPVWNGSPSTLVMPLPNGLSLVGSNLFLQAYFRDPAGFSAPEPIRLTNAIQVGIGAP